MNTYFYQIKCDRIWIFERKNTDVLVQRYRGSIYFENSDNLHIIQELEKQYQMIELSNKVNYKKQKEWYRLEYMDES